MKARGKVGSELILDPVLPRKAGALSGLTTTDALFPGLQTPTGQSLEPWLEAWFWGSLPGF